MKKKILQINIHHNKFSHFTCSSVSFFFVLSSHPQGLSTSEYKWEEIFRHWIICLFNESNFLALIFSLHNFRRNYLRLFLSSSLAHCRDVLSFLIYALWRWEWKKIFCVLRWQIFLIIMPLIYEIKRKRVSVKEYLWEEQI